MRTFYNEEGASVSVFQSVWKTSVRTVPFFIQQYADDIISDHYWDRKLDKKLGKPEQITDKQHIKRLRIKQGLTTNH